MIKYSDNRFENMTVRLDGCQFISCKFISCNLEYSGLGQVSLVQCEFDNVKWSFTGPAKNTLQFLRGLYHGMGEQGRQLVDITFNNIRKADG